MEKVNNTIEIVERLKKDIDEILSRELRSLTELRKRLLERELDELKRE